jgi:hypothetical protein
VLVNIDVEVKSCVVDKEAGILVLGCIDDVVVANVLVANELVADELVELQIIF